MAEVLGFRKRQEDDLPDTSFFDLAGLSSSGLPGDCRIGWESVARSHVFSDRLVSEEASRSSAVCCHCGHAFCFTVKSECGEGHGGLHPRTSYGGSIPGGDKEFAW